MLVHRSKGVHPEWIDEEREIVRELYPSAPREEILQALPTKTWRSIRTEAIRLGVSRTVKLQGEYPSTLTWLDVVFMRDQGISDLNRIYVEPPRRETSLQTLGGVEEMLTRLRLLFATHHIA
jgi:hypothetical protein